MQPSAAQPSEHVPALAPSASLSVPRVRHVGLVGRVALLACAVVAVQTACHLVNAIALESRVWGLSADVDGNMFSWASSVTTFTAALAVLVIARGLGEGRLRLLALAGVLAFFSLDDIAAFHERVGMATVELLDLERGFVRATWPALFLPLLLGCLVLLRDLARKAPAEAGRALRIGLFLLVGAVATEAGWSAWHVLGGSEAGWPDALEVSLEEGLELAGWILVAAGLAAGALAQPAAAQTRVYGEGNGR